MKSWFLFMWCWIAIFLAPVHAALNTKGEGNFTSSAYVVFDDDVASSEALKPILMEFSFTDAFLHAVRMMQTAADVPHQPHEQNQGVPDNDDETDQEPFMDYDNLDILQDFPGDQEWWFFRPDPHNLGRRETMHLQVTAATSMREIEQSLTAAWPDLRPGRPDWEILLAHYNAFDGFHAPLTAGSSAFIVKVQNDLDQGLAQRSIILLSLRTWIATTGYAATSPLRAFVVDTQSYVREFFQSIDFHQRCDRAPCAIEHNGQVITPWNHEYPLRCWDGDFVQVQAVARAEALMQITGLHDASHYPTLDEMPEAFQQNALQSLTGLGVEDDQILLITGNFQISMTSWIRDIYKFTEMQVIIKQRLGVFLPEGDNIVFMRFNLQTPFNVYDLYDGIVQYMLDGDEQNWNFVAIKEIANSHLNMDTQILGIHLETHQSFFELDALCLVEIHLQQNFRGTLAFPDIEYKSRYFPVLMTEEQMWGQLDLDRLCIDEDCTTVVDGRFILRGDRFAVEDGSFIQIYIGDEHETMSTQSEAGETSELIGHTQEMEIHAAEGPRDVEQPDLTTGQFGSLPFSPWGSICLSLHKHFPALSWGLFLTSWTAVAIQLQVMRVGEAQHPGPRIWIGTTNPSGLRGKEESYFELPTGIWGISETHLTALNQRNANSAMHRLSLRKNRFLQLQHGAPVLPRTASSTAGTWSGVSIATDLACRAISIPWPHSEFALGRVQLVQAWYGPFHVSGANLYGWPKSPTWPRATEATEQLLAHVTKEMVLSRTGPRFVIGDFNCDVLESPSVAIWKAQGWINIQDWAFEQHGRAYTYTSKQVNILDHVFVSPELAQFLCSVDSWNLFADHTAIGAEFDIPVRMVEQVVWPMPAYIPYGKVNMEKWHQQPLELNIQGSVDERFQQLSVAFENSFDGCIDAPGQKLPPAMRGRGQKSSPEKRQQQTPLLRPSRPGEVQPSSDLLGRTVHKWFLQLRRLQSMLHSLKANKQTWDAWIYRAELWRSIKQAKGFEQGFVKWWTLRQVQCQGSPQNWPDRVPTVQVMQCLFQDYEINYRRFEAWHAKQRSDMLQLTLMENQEKVFAMVRPTCKAPLQHLEERWDVPVLGISDDRTQLHLEQEIPVDNTCIAEIDRQHIHVTAADGPVVSLAAKVEEEDPEMVRITKHHSTVDQIQEHLAAFWKARWWKEPPSHADWQRIFDFCAAYIPKQPEMHEDITLAQWHTINKRYGKTSARGPDGYARRDLQWMPECLQEEMVCQINNWEATGTFPKPLCTGFVHPLPKREDSVLVNDFRPVIIYSMIYRSWSSLRARQYLKLIKTFAGCHQFGFLPQKENTEIWMVLQGWIEDSTVSQQAIAGYVADIEKAFECLPREPLLWLGRRMGMSRKVLAVWKFFLDNMTRRFMLSNQIGPALASTSGFPEGCGMSCVAMALTNVVFHKYMDAYSRITSLSFVDNLELVGRSVQSVHEGVLTMEAWASMWMLKLDASKCYAWASSPTLRSQCQAAGWNIKTHAKDLGAPMTYGSKHSVVDQLDRIKALKPLWAMLRRLNCPTWAKQRVLFQAMWPRAYYGSAICCMSWTHTKALRTEAMRALKWNRGGASPGMRLGVLSAPLTDPGYYHFWQTILTFRRVLQKQPGFLDLWKS